jgi:hypothetical protein
MAKRKTIKERHLLYHSWAWMRRMSARHNMCNRWFNDFYSFVEDIGDRPSSSHRITRKNQEKGYYKENCEWKESYPSKDKADYARNWRKNNPNNIKNSELKKSFGIDLETYNVMLKKQNGVCAICKKPEKFNTSLAVDHCHISKKIRGLLCTNCNRALGMFNDSVLNLYQAINYLQAD